MKISNIIKILEDYQEKHGDIEVKVWDDDIGTDPNFVFEEKQNLLYLSPKVNEV